MLVTNNTTSTFVFPDIPYFYKPSIIILRANDTRQISMEEMYPFLPYIVPAITSGSITLTYEQADYDWLEVRATLYNVESIGAAEVHTGILVNNTGLQIHSVDGIYHLTIQPGSLFTANRVLQIITGDANRALTITGNAALDQDVRIASSPTFNTINPHNIRISSFTIGGFVKNESDGTLNGGNAINMGVDITGILPMLYGGTGANNAGTARGNLGLGTISTQAADNVAITGGSITGVVISTARTITTVNTTPYTLLAGDDLVVINSGSAVTIDLYTATGSGKVVTFKNIGIGVVTLSGDGADVLDGELTQTLNQYEGVNLIDYAANTWILI